MDVQSNEPAAGGFDGAKLEIVIDPAAKPYVPFQLAPEPSIFASDHV